MIAQPAHVHDCGCVPARLPAAIGHSLVWACWLTALTIGWNGLEAAVAIVGGVQAGSVALVAFALDSMVEVGSGLVIAWKLTHQGDDPEENERRERRAVRLIAVSFFVIAAYVTAEAVLTLAGVAPEPRFSGAGLAIVALSLLFMPVLARGKRHIGRRLDSAAIQADAAESQLCMWLSAAVLIGLAGNALLGWWWLDAAAGLTVAAAAIWEGRHAWMSGDLCC